MSAWHDHRRPQPLFLSALEVAHDGTRYVIEMAPVWNTPEPERGDRRLAGRVADVIS